MCNASTVQLTSSENAIMVCIMYASWINTCIIIIIISSHVSSPGVVLFYFQLSVYSLLTANLIYHKVIMDLEIKSSLSISLQSSLSSSSLSMPHQINCVHAPVSSISIRVAPVCPKA